MKNFPLALLIGLALSGGAARAQDAILTEDATLSQSPLINYTSKNAFLGALQASVQAKKRQFAGEGGLVLQIDIVNPTAESARLRHLPDLIHIYLVNEKGKLFGLPNVPPDKSRLGTHCYMIFPPPGYKIPLVTPYELLSITSNDRVLTHDEIEAESIVLEAKGHLSLRLAIHRVLLSAPTETTPQTKLQEDPLPPGTYAIKPVFTVFLESPQSASAYFRVPYEKPKPLIVDYSEPAAK